MIYLPKSQPAPDCLAQEQRKASGDYKCGCVLERLKSDFKNKCYICGSTAPTSINVEHFIPHQGDTALKFAWPNLFWSCGHCNNTKLAQYSPLLNCTEWADAALLSQALRYICKPFPHEKVQIETDSTDISVVNTQQLLLAVFNGTTTLKNIEADNLREQLLHEIKDYQDWLIDYYKAHDDDEKRHCLRKIKSHLHAASAFTAFKRQIVKDNPRMFKDFGSYCND